MRSSQLPKLPRATLETCSRRNLIFQRLLGEACSFCVILFFRQFRQTWQLSVSAIFTASVAKVPEKGSFHFGLTSQQGSLLSNFLQACGLQDGQWVILPGQKLGGLCSYIFEPVIWPRLKRHFKSLIVSGSTFISENKNGFPYTFKWAQT